MTVNIIIPVFNRINDTKKIISNLRVQNTSEEIKVLIIDDGSTDGTSEWLKSQKDLFFLRGNGKLLWGGAINLGINYIIKNHPNDEWILLINNDLEVNFYRCKLQTGRTHQIRVHFSHLNSPILGDDKYGKNVKPGKIPENIYQII